MNSLKFLTRNVFFTTRSFALSTNVATATATRQLKRMVEQNQLTSVTRGVWAQTEHPYFSPYGALPYLLGNEQGYLSFLSALHRFEVISQIPRVIQVSTTGHGRKLHTPLGDFEFFHIDPRWGWEGVEVFAGKVPYNMASAERAFIDTLNLASRKSKRFRVFPELDLTLLNRSKLAALLSGLKPATRTRIEGQLQRIGYLKIRGE